MTITRRGQMDKGIRRRRGQWRPRPLVFSCPGCYLQPEQEAQQSAEAQHEEVARAAPAKPSATTATNRIALILFINFLLYEC
jgi:hypothetical protein